MYDDWSGTWLPDEKYSFAYNAEDQLTERTRFMDSAGWIPNFKEVWSYYPNGDYKTISDGSYNKSSQKWELTDRETYENEYDADGDIIVSIATREPFKYKNVYSYTESSDIGKSNPSKKRGIYPNPPRPIFMLMSLKARIHQPFI